VNIVDGRPVPTPDGAGAPDVIVYWRPGCPFCRSLRRGLKRAGLPTHEIDIWSDPEGAAFVRTHADGNETVPTVVIGESVLVNPPTRRVVALAADAGIIADRTVGNAVDSWWRRWRP